MTKRIPASDVVRLPQAALVVSDDNPDGNPITVVPLVDGDHVAGMEVRCRCGSRAVIDCVFEGDAASQASGPGATP